MTLKQDDNIKEMMSFGPLPGHSMILQKMKVAKIAPPPPSLVSLHHIDPPEGRLAFPVCRLTPIAMGGQYHSNGTTFIPM